MGTNILEERMLEDTLTTFRDVHQQGVTPAQGIMLIDGWLQAMEGDPNIDHLKDDLNALRGELQATPPNAPQIKSLMGTLATKTQQVAEAPNSEGTWTGSLELLSKALRSFSDSL